MGLASWTYFALNLAVISWACGLSDAGELRVSGSRGAPEPQAGIPVRRVVFQAGRSPARLLARWIGQDGHDYVGPNNQPVSSDIQDVHIELANLDAAREVASVELTAEGDTWHYNVKSVAWRAEFKRAKGARTADLFVEAARKETGRPFRLLMRYADGATAIADFRGGKASPTLRMPSAVLSASWIGQDRQDWAGAGPSVGPDGFQDVHIRVSGLSPKLRLKLLRIECSSGARWEFGANPKLANNAELVRQEKDPSRGDLYFQPDRDLNGERLRLLVAYDTSDHDTIDTASIAAGRCDPKLPMPAWQWPKVAERAVTAKWLGQDGANTGSPGDVHVALSGLSGVPAIAGAVLADGVRGAWLYRAAPAAPPRSPTIRKPKGSRSSEGPTERRSIYSFRRCAMRVTKR